jgi:hypothetical protein
MVNSVAMQQQQLELFFFFVVRSGNDVRQQWANATVKVFSLWSDHRLYNQANQLSQSRVKSQRRDSV